MSACDCVLYEMEVVLWNFHKRGWRWAAALDHGDDQVPGLQQLWMLETEAQHCLGAAVPVPIGQLASMVGHGPGVCCWARTVWSCCRHSGTAHRRATAWAAGPAYPCRAQSSEGRGNLGGAAVLPWLLLALPQPPALCIPAAYKLRILPAYLIVSVIPHAHPARSCGATRLPSGMQAASGWCTLTLLQDAIIWLMYTSPPSRMLSSGWCTPACLPASSC